MIACLISLGIAVLVAVVVVWVIETYVGALIALPAPVFTIIRVIVALIVLLYALQCLGLAGGGEFWPRR